jgi:cell division protein FtsN
MARSRTPRSPLDRGQPAFELTSHQIIIAISAMLLWGALCFVFGIIATKLEMRVREKPTTEIAGLNEVKKPSVADTTSKQPISPRSELDKTTAASGEGRQTSPRQDVFDSSASERPEGTKLGGSSSPTGMGKAAGAVPDVHLPVKVPAPSPQKEQPAAEPPKPAAASTSKPAAPMQPLEPGEEDEQPPTASTPKGGEPPATAAKTPSAQPEASVSVTPAAKQPEGAKPADTSQPTAQKPDTSAAKIEPLPPPESPIEATAPAPKGRFAIQVASFDTKGSAKAEEYRQKVAKDTGLEGRVVPSEDGKHLRVLLGAYSTRDAAQKARDELRKRKEFAGCYVQALQ